jgi:uncharacterized membrane protein YfcA
MYIGEIMEKSKAKNGLWLLCGVAVGVVNSLFGGGGGMLAVPLLEKMGLEEKRAHATAILWILPVSALSFLLYVWQGFYRSSVLIPTALGVTAGGLVGAKLLGKLPVKGVNLTFALLQAAAGVFLLI